MRTTSPGQAPVRSGLTHVTVTMAAAHRTYAYQQARQALRDQHPQPCALCHEHIDYALTYPHPGSFTAEHLLPARMGGDHTTLAPAHLGCQRSQGARVVNAARSGTSDHPVTSRRW